MFFNHTRGKRLCEPPLLLTARPPPKNDNAPWGSLECQVTAVRKITAHSQQAATLKKQASLIGPAFGRFEDGGSFKIKKAGHAPS
jgi:hypothetical protein